MSKTKRRDKAQRRAAAAMSAAGKWKPNASKGRSGHDPECVSPLPHFVPPSLGQIGFQSCNVPDDIQNHTRCRPPYDHDNDEHRPID